MAVVHKSYILRWILWNNEPYIKVAACDHITAVAVNINISLSLYYLITLAHTTNINTTTIIHNSLYRTWQARYKYIT